MVAKVEHHRGELFPQVGFIVTNLSLPSQAVVRFYNKPGTAEQWIKEGKCGEDDAAVVSSIPVQRSALAVEPVGLQPGKPVAAAGEDGRAVGETCAVLLAAVGRWASDAAGVRGDSAVNLGRCSCRRGKRLIRGGKLAKNEAGRERCLANQPESRQVPGFRSAERAD
jgi:hypothetical protein